MAYTVNSWGQHICCPSTLLIHHLQRSFRSCIEMTFSPPACSEYIHLPTGPGASGKSAGGVHAAPRSYKHHKSPDFNPTGQNWWLNALKHSEAICQSLWDGKLWCCVAMVMGPHGTGICFLPPHSLLPCSPWSDKHQKHQPNVMGHPLEVLWMNDGKLSISRAWPPSAGSTMTW